MLDYGPYIHYMSTPKARSTSATSMHMAHALKFPKMRGTFLRIRIKRIIVVWGLYWGPLI